MTPMRISSVTAISDRRVARATAARRRLQQTHAARRSRGGGRVWVNGRELGGAEPRFAHLAQSFD